MGRGEFIRRGEKNWRTLERVLDQGQKSRRKGRSAQDSHMLPAMFRRVCQDLALARHRLYSTRLVERLNRLALRAHEEMYVNRVPLWARIAAFAGGGFPRLVREQGWLAITATLLFFGPFIGLILLVSVLPDVAYMFLPEETLDKIESMYSGGDSVGPRGADGDVAAFGFYVKNNTSIGFRCFAWGLLFGVGAILQMLYNGVVLGVVFGHINNVGGGTALNSFAIGHGSFELTAIVISGLAGLRLGMGLIAPGRRSRMQSLKESAKVALPLILGGGAMFVIAAFIEAFWSPRVGVSPAVKYWVGGALWVLVIGYFTLGGRSFRRREG